MRSRLLLLAALAVAAFGFPDVGTATAAAPAPVVLDGHGNGHGVGLSQWGAFGYAVDKGWTAAQILDHYYSGTVAGTVPLNTMVRVRLQHFDDAQTAVSVQSGSLVVQGIAGEAWKSVLVRETATNGVYAVWARNDLVRCPSAVNDPAADGWTLVAPSKAGPVDVRTAVDSATVTDPTQLLAACEPNGTLRWYRGTIRALNDTSGRNRTLSVLPMEQYLRTVIAMEMSPGWAAATNGVQALQAQAIAARSFALAHQWYTYADVCDMMCQSYFGTSFQASGGAVRRVEHPNTDAAVLATAGMVRRVGTSTGPIALTMFSASNGGFTSPGSGSLQPFAAVADAGDATAGNPNHDWSVTLDPAVIAAKYPAIGSFVGLTVLTRNGYGEWGGRVLTLRLTGSAGTQVVSGAAFRTAMRLKDTWFHVRDVSSPPAPCTGQVAPPVGGPLPSPTGTMFTPVRPVRLLYRTVEAGCVLVVDPNLAAGARSVEVVLTAIAPSASGTVSAWACGTPPTTTPVMQAVAGRTTSSTVVVPLGADGTFCVGATGTTRLLVDHIGTYAVDTGSRFQPIAPVRLSDSRSGALPAAGTLRVVQVAGTARIPAGATAASFTIHTTGATGTGTVTAYACGAARPSLPSIRVTYGIDATTTVQTALGSQGRLCLYVTAGMHLVVDVHGWFGAAATTKFHAVNGERFLDVALSAGQTKAFAITAAHGIPAASTVKALMGEVTATSASASGYLTEHACAATVPAISMVRMAPNAPAATEVVGIDDASGRWCLTSSVAVRVTVDVVGWYA